MDTLRGWGYGADAMGRPPARALLLAGCLWVGYGHACHAHYGHHHCDDHHHDDDCDHDHDHDRSSGGGWVLDGWDSLEPGAGPGWHPVGRVTGCRGVSLAPDEREDPHALLQAAARVIEANPELLGLPDEGFVPVGVHFEPDESRVALVQLLGGWVVPGGEGTLVFDAEGRLVEIVNRGRLAVGF